MKIIYLQDENYNWKSFEFEKIKDLKDEFLKRNIKIGDSATIGDFATIGDSAKIGDSATIGDFAKIGDSATIGNFATIGDSAKIGDSATIGDFAKIGDFATIGNFAKIGDSATIGNFATIGDSAKIGDSATIGDFAKIGDFATIGNNISLLKSFFIATEKHPITYCGNSTLSIGCVTKSIEWFKENYEFLGKKEHYSDAQILEYKNYILLAEKFSKT